MKLHSKNKAADDGYFNHNYILSADEIQFGLS